MKTPAFRGRRATVLAFDIECRPGAWYGGDFVTKIPTAIAWKWVAPARKMESIVLGQEGYSLGTSGLRKMIEEFVPQLLGADVVIGHYVRGFDLPLLNATLVRLGLGPLQAVAAHDTKLDLVSAHGISKSLENLGSLFGLRHSKVHMSVPEWESAYAGDSVELQRKRVEGDVRLNISLRAHLLKHNLLGQPRTWEPGALGSRRYSP